MRDYRMFYIDGAWVEPEGTETQDLVNPASEEISGRIALGTVGDVDKAMAAARRAFATWSLATREERLALLRRIKAEFEVRQGDLAAAITEEMGAPASLAGGFHTFLGLGHLDAAIAALEGYEFEEKLGDTLVVKEPIGVCGLITPWNWPINQVTVKVFPALATGCTVVLKPPQLAAYSAQILAEILDAAGVPAGVFNMVQGKGSVIGTALSTHPDVDMISFTGSESVGVQIQKDAAETVKRVCLELGGKSPYIVLDDASTMERVASAVSSMMMNSGQTCSAGSRLLVPAARFEEAKALAAKTAEAVAVGDPVGNVAMGPVVSQEQFDTVQNYIAQGIAEGAELIAGGPGRPEGLNAGFYVKPTVFVSDNSTVIAREEIFGPVLVMIPYEGIEDAIAIANDTDFGLAAYVDGEDIVACRAIARRIRAGAIYLNGGFDFAAPFGGYKRSGNGREWGAHGFAEYLETKSILGHG
ncbi:aldehyde dehydrogenase family protein [Novosphingobium mangrovi (ex Hu et al. 2023)]|uniref:Aldehyde dehydrogenase family protein n=1 Tax=Novosphingobium mangrovi (ex Hu et al. 2023) TaxID=2930094 RepID=A0ABT0AET9_9SPHN|nr:aldehyde dehydrogenase family protein [Novosphingobium mangrovi (ex Hu et al. 2023)]MCJ1961669.1 aldehyde dehydrogenase family protein [Novosphingobium mangrovi (ex Hu et al. 2023)]